MRQGLWIAAAGCVAGCADVGSGDVLTHGMWADLTYSADGTGTSQAVTVLRVGGALSNTYVELQGDDALTATLSGETVPMFEEQLGDVHRYVAGFATAPVGETLTVAFERTVDAGAPSSVAELPPEFVLDPLGVTTLSRGSEDLVLTWGPLSAETMRIDVTGDCVFSYRTEITDAGTFTLLQDTLEPLDANAATSCSLDLAVTRVLPGSIDPAFGEGGSAAGLQIRTKSVSSTP